MFLCRGLSGLAEQIHHSRRRRIREEETGVVDIGIIIGQIDRDGMQKPTDIFAVHVFVEKIKDFLVETVERLEVMGWKKNWIIASVVERERDWHKRRSIRACYSRRGRENDGPPRYRGPYAFIRN